MLLAGNAGEEHDASYRRGFEAGLAKGREEGAEAARAAARSSSASSMGRSARAFDEAVRGVTALQRGYWSENRKVVVELALAIAERLLRWLQLPPEQGAEASAALRATVERLWSWEGVAQRALAASEAAPAAPAADPGALG